MRRTLALAVLLTTTPAAEAGIGDGPDGLRILGGCLAVCVGLPFFLMLALSITLAIYDWRKTCRKPPAATRTTPPPGN